MISWLPAEPVFPALSTALSTPNGLLAAGGDLSPERLLLAYAQGIFPWYSPGEPILWWSPDPRMVLFPDEIRVSRSLGKTLRRGNYEVRVDTDFDAVVAACAQTPRPGQNGTWIAPEMQAAYSELHRLGFAHSIETWVAGELVGGLYGVAIGHAFYGESMFAWRTDASKIALAHLGVQLRRLGFGIIDCQMETSHLASLGARPIPRSEFRALLDRLVIEGPRPGRWQADALRDAFRS